MIEQRLLRCSFCGRKETEVSKRVAGPRVYICDPCVVLASRIMARDCDQDSRPPVRKSTAWDRLMARARQFWLALPPPLVLNQKPLDNGYFTP